MMVLTNLWRRKARTALTIAGITIGISVVVTLLILAEGLAGQLSELTSSGGAEITLIQDGVADMQFSILDEEIGQAVGEMPEVEWVSGMLLQIVTIPQRPFFIVVGIDTQGAAMDHFRLVEGTLVVGEGEMLLGRMAAGYLGLEPGDTMGMQGQRLRIVGIYESGAGFQDAGAVLPLSVAQELFRRPDQVTLYQVKVEGGNPETVAGVIEEIEARFPEVIGYRSADFGRNTPDIQNLQVLAGAISLVGLLAGALGTMNTMLMSVFERTREIGTLRALGWRKRQVLGMVLGESLTLSLIGGLLGVACGVGIAAFIVGVAELQGMLVIRITADTVLTGLFVALLLGALGGLYPAWHAARLLPVEALRYE